MARRIQRGDVSHVICRHQRLKEDPESGKIPTSRCIDEGISASEREIRKWIRGSVERHTLNT